MIFGREIRKMYDDDAVVALPLHFFVYTQHALFTPISMFHCLQGGLRETYIHTSLSSGLHDRIHRTWT